jgi:pimeloyl-ACP methyl ester carboxylesterase
VRASSPDALVGGAQALATRPDYTPLLSRVEVPTLVYLALEDTVYPLAVARSLAEAIPGATLLTVPDAAHAAVLEAPNRTNAELIRWARGHLDGMEAGLGPRHM